MQPAVLIRMRPSGPWRYGPGDGARNRVDSVYRSDRLFSAVTLAMQQLGFLEEWLDATARRPGGPPAFAFTSLFPYQGDSLFATPPASVWPPPASQLTAPNPAFLGKIRWNAVRLAPLTVIEALLMGRSVAADQWIADPATGFLLRRERPGSAPFRIAARTSAAVDRITRTAFEAASVACIEFEPDSGLWTLARYRDRAAASAWQERLESCFRLLADSGFGGRRTQGWGKTDAPDFRPGTWPGLILPKLGRQPDNAGEGGEQALYWLLSLYSPAVEDAVDWSGGDYRVTVRGGRVESPAASGSLKKNARMIVEGSILAARHEPAGAAVNVAPDQFVHPVYRSGFAVALKLPAVRAASDLALVENAGDELPMEPPPCEQGVSAEPPVDNPPEAGGEAPSPAAPSVEDVVGEGFASAEVTESETAASRPNEPVETSPGDVGGRELAEGSARHRNEGIETPSAEGAERELHGI